MHLLQKLIDLAALTLPSLLHCVQLIKMFKRTDLDGRLVLIQEPQVGFIILFF
jgi:hypothetical protein